MVLATLGVLLVTLGLRKLTSFQVNAPSVCVANLIVGDDVRHGDYRFRLPYSLYYFGLSGVIGAVFFFYRFYLAKAHQPYMAYISMGHCQNFKAIFKSVGCALKTGT